MSIVVTPDGRRSVERQGYPFAPARATNLLGQFSAGNIGLSGGVRATYRYIYRTQPWVYIAINKIAKSFANLPLHTFTQDADTGEHIRVRPGDGVQGQLAQLFKNPTPFESEWDLKFAIATELFIHGHYLGVKTNARGQVTDGTNGALPAELWTVPWQNVEMIEGIRRPIDGFNVWLSGQKYPFAPEEVVHIQMQYGLSPLEPLRRTLNIEDAALRETQASFENGNKINGILVAPEKARKLSDNDRELIRQEFASRHGGVDNAYRTAVIGGGLSWQATQFDHTEAQLIPVRQLAREEVAAAIDIPPPMIGILDHATYSNWEQAHRGFYMDSIGPVCVKVEESLEVQLVAPEPEWSGLDLEFDMDEALKADLSGRAEAYSKLIRVGFTVDEIRGFENKPQFGSPLSTTAWVAQDLMPAGEDALATWKDAQVAKNGSNNDLSAALQALASRPDPAPLVLSPSADPELRAAIDSVRGQIAAMGMLNEFERGVSSVRDLTAQTFELRDTVQDSISEMTDEVERRTKADLERVQEILAQQAADAVAQSQQSLFDLEVRLTANLNQRPVRQEFKRNERGEIVEVIDIGPDDKPVGRRKVQRKDGQVVSVR